MGEVKISLFELTEGRMAKAVVGTYVAAISRERYQHYSTKLNEPLEQITEPTVSVLDDETADGMVQLIHRYDFYALPGGSLEQVDFEDIKRPDFKTKLITVEINGVAHTVIYDALPEAQRQTFNILAKAIFLALETTDVKAVTEKQDWREVFQEYLKEH